MRRAVDRAININEVCDVNPFGVEALKAAYTPEGEAWLRGLREYLWENYRQARELLRQEAPHLPVARLEATYLMWVDVSATGIPSEKLEEMLLKKARVWVNCGEMYGADGFIRINLACPRQRLLDGLRRILLYLSDKLHQNS